MNAPKWETAFSSTLGKYRILSQLRGRSLTMSTRRGTFKVSGTGNVNGVQISSSMSTWVRQVYGVGRWSFMGKIWSTW